MLPELRSSFNQSFRSEDYRDLLALLARRCGGKIEFRVAETPIFVSRALLDEMAEAGAEMTRQLLADPEYLQSARSFIPKGYAVAGSSDHPHFLTADFALVRDPAHGLTPKLVEIQAFPSVFAYQDELSKAYREVYGLPDSLGSFLGGLDGTSYWELLKRTILGGHGAENVVLTEVDPSHQKTFPDFFLTSERLGIPVVDIATLEAVGDKLHYRDPAGKLIPIHRIYNRAIADELISREVALPFDLGHAWDVEWAGHPNWYFLISKYSIPWLSGSKQFTVIPPAVFLDQFLAGRGWDELEAAGVTLPARSKSAVYSNLLLKPLFSFAGKGIEFEPTAERLAAIPPDLRSSYILQQRMHFEPTVETPFGLTQAEIRILYMWPDGGALTPALSLVRLGRGKMMGVDHNKNQEWVGGSAAFYI